MINNNLNNSQNNTLETTSPNLLNSPKSPKLSPNSPSKRKRPQEFKNFNPSIKRKFNFDNEICEISHETFESISNFHPESAAEIAFEDKKYVQIKIETYNKNDTFNTISINKIFIENFGLKFFSCDNEIYQLNQNIDEIFQNTYLSTLTEKKIENIVYLLNQIHFNIDDQLNSLKVTKENFTSLLLFSKNSLNLELLKRCITFKCNELNDLTIETYQMNGEFNFAISIKNLRHLPFIEQLSQFFNKKIEIKFFSEENLNKRYLKKFALEFGDKIKELNLSQRKTIKILLPHCINAKKICLHSNAMTTEELTCIQEMKDLDTLTIFCCNRIKHLPNLQQLKNLKKLILICNNLQTISFLPHSLEFLEIISPHVKLKNFFIAFLSILTKENIWKIDVNNFKLSNNNLSAHLVFFLNSIKTEDSLFFLLEKFSEESRFEFYYEIFMRNMNSKIHELLIQIIHFFLEDDLKYLDAFIKDLFDGYINNPVTDVKKINFNHIIKNEELIEFINKKLKKPTIQEFVFAFNTNIGIPIDCDISKFFNHSLVKDDFTISRVNLTELNCTLKVINHLYEIDEFRKQILEIIQTEHGIKFITSPLIRKKIFKYKFSNLIDETYPISKKENSRFYPVFFKEMRNQLGEKFLVTELSFYHLNQEFLFTIAEIALSIKKFSTDKFFIRFFDYPASDYGGDGITRHCFNHLFKKTSEYFSLKTNIPQFSNKNEKSFHRLGTILYSLYRNTTVILGKDPQSPVTIPNYPVGPIFKENFFEGLYLFKKEELEMPFSHISSERIFEICSHYCAKDPQFISLNRFLNWNESEFDDEMIDYIRELIGLEMLDKPAEMNQDEELSLDLLIKYKNYFKDTIKADYILTQKGQLQTLFSIAKGMTLNPFFQKNFWTLTNSIQLKNIITGKEFCRKTLKESFEFRENIPQNFQKFFHDFVDHGKEKEVKHFLTYVSGSESLPFNKITVKIDPLLTGDQVKVLSCFNLIEIPENLTLEQLEINLRHWIEEIENKQS